MTLPNISLYKYYGKPLPSREDFHRGYAGEITTLDFSTQYPNPLRLAKQFSAQRFNHSMQHISVSCDTKAMGGAYE